MAFEKIKSVVRLFGMYRMARWVYRHVINREDLRAFREELAFYAQFVSPGCLCFDVGANYGAKTEVFLRLGARVVAFEPQRDCIKEFHARLGANARLVTINAAVGSHAGQATLFTRRHRTCSSLLKEWEGTVEDTVEVQVTTLDDNIARCGVPKYCKIDVEGFELEVLKGLSRPIPILSFEYHLDRKDGVATVLACLDHLSGLGELLMNIAPAEKPMFARSEWLAKGEFLDFFREEVPRLPGYHYGDIFVKMQEPPVPQT